MPRIICGTAAKWGIAGAAGVVLAGVFLIVVQEAARFGSPLQQTANHAWLVVARPVLWVWETLGVRGAEDLHLVVPMLVSVLLYLAASGFIGGVILRRATHSL